MDERRQINGQLGGVRSECLKELKREEYRRKDKDVKVSAQAGKTRMILTALQKKRKVQQGTITSVTSTN